MAFAKRIGDRSQCKGCDEFKPDSEWYFNIRKRRGRVEKVRRYCIACMRRKSLEQVEKIKQDPEWHARYLKRRRNQRWWDAYGITEAQYMDMNDRQGGLCAICQQPETHRNPKTGPIVPLSVDHDHVTGKVRALLCHACNGGLGKFKDDLQVMQAAVDYLRQHVEPS